MNTLTAAAATKAAMPTAPRSMTLSSIKRGRLEKPLRVILYGVEGVGKSTWAANAPDPIFLAAEDGTSELDVARFPEPKRWSDALDAIDELTTGDHGYKTLVIDTLDWLEPLVWKVVCDRAKQENIESFGYGRGYIAAIDDWRIFLARLERMREVRNMGIVMLAHGAIKTFKNPDGDDFDRYALKLNKHAADLFKEWSDAVLFTRFETFTDKDSKTKRVRGISTGARVVHSVWTALYDAKNRQSLHETMPLDYEAFASAVRAHQTASPVTLRSRIAEALEKAGVADLTARVQAAVAAAGDDANQLARIENKLSATVGIAGGGQ